MKFILYDGHCTRCNRFASFIEKRVEQSELSLFPLASEEGKVLLKKYKLPENYQESVVFIKDNQAHINSSATIYCIISLKKCWRIAYVGFLIPLFIRDFIYKQIAKRRKKNVCEI